MATLLVKTVRELPNGNILLEKRLYFLSERDIMELRKKTNWVKGAHGYFAGSYPEDGGSAGKLGLTNGVNGGIIKAGSGKVEQAKTRDKKIEITDIAISKANPPLIPGFSDEQNARFKELHQELLRLAKDRNDSNEVAFLFDPKTMGYEKAFGGVSNVDIFENPIARDMYRNSSVGKLYLLHNHPSTKSFSYSDLGVLLLNENLGGITVVTNSGYIEVLQKTENYNLGAAFGFLKHIRSEYGHTALNEEQDAEIVKRFIKAGNKFGITLLSRR